jgi:protein arginine kinase
MGGGSTPDLILSSRARLARNLTALPFVHRTKKSDLARIIHQVEAAVRSGHTMAQARFVYMPETSELDRQFLVERRLISPALAEGDRQAGVFVKPTETASLMVNEEDHLRIQAIHGGLDLEGAWQEADRIDSELGQTLDFAFSEEFGYLTACPTNVGTGIRMSVLMHLPGLTLTQNTEPVIRAMREIGVAVRGLYGEGTGTLGNLYQVSNQWTLGYTEQDVIARLHHVVSRLITYEQRAYEALLREARIHLENRAWRAYALLAHSRLLTEPDALEALSTIRMGWSMGVFSRVDLVTLNRLLLITQAAHVQKIAGRALDMETQDTYRATLVRDFLNSSP